MNTFSEELVWRRVAGPTGVRRAGRQATTVEPLFPDDERILERFNLGPETDDLCRELTYALREVGRFLSNLMVPGGPEARLLSE